MIGAYCRTQQFLLFFLQIGGLVTKRWTKQSLIWYTLFLSTELYPPNVSRHQRTLAFSHRREASVAALPKRMLKMFTLCTVSRTTLSSINRCMLPSERWYSWFSRKKIVTNETADSKVCGLSWVTRPWFLERTITLEFIQCIFWYFEHHKLNATSWMPSSSSIFKRRQSSLQSISPKLVNAHQNNLDD